MISLLRGGMLGVAGLFLLLAFLLQLPQAFGLLVARRDAAALLYPPVILLRNVVGAFGYGVGFMMKALRRV